MIKNYIKIAFRNFGIHKLNSFINLVGLSLGLAACILITMYVSHEKSYDQFHKDSDKIYNIVGNFKIGDDYIRMSGLSPVVPQRLKESSPNIEDTFRYYTYYDPLNIKTNKSSSEIFPEDNISAVDANFFSFFSFELLRGNVSKALENPFSVVLTNKIAEKYFGKSNPIGKQIIVKQDSAYNFTVTGVIKQFPTNSSIEADILFSISSLPLMKETRDLFNSQLFQGGSIQTYLKVKNSDKVVSIEDAATKLDKLDNKDSTTTYELLKFDQMHLAEIDTGRFNYLNIFPIVALLILILALSNYISLTTARANKRAKEVGVRKISGANRKSLALQFYLESGIFVCISFVLGILITVIFKDRFLELLNIKIDDSFFFNWSFLSLLIVVLVFAIVASGVYPAMVLSAFNPIRNFRNKIGRNNGSVTVRKIATTFQFTIAVLLVICGVVMANQLDFMRHKDTGIDRSNVVMIPVETSISTNATVFRNEVEKLPEVGQTSVSMNKMYGGYNMFFTTKENSDKNYSIATFSVDEHFIETLGVSWYIQPRELKAFSGDKKVIINQKTISKLGLKPDPIGEKINFGNQFYEIAGVVKDFNYTSLESPINPLAFFVSSKVSANKDMMGNVSTCLYVKYADGIELSTLISKIETVYTSFDETTPFSYQFMDDAFDKLYKAEERMSSILYVFMILALIIAGLGLLGLVTFASEQRLKEIGIRKLLGASISEIVLLLSTDFIKLVALAIIIAVPIAWYLADAWLNDFTYKIDMPWWSFLTAGLITVVLSVIILSFQTIKAAIANPVNALKSE